MKINTLHIVSVIHFHPIPKASETENKSHSAPKNLVELYFVIHLPC